jgi:hypothetical protein
MLALLAPSREGSLEGSDINLPPRHKLLKSFLPPTCPESRGAISTGLDDPAFLGTAALPVPIREGIVGDGVHPSPRVFLWSMSKQRGCRRESAQVYENRGVRNPLFCFVKPLF